MSRTARPASIAGILTLAVFGCMALALFMPQRAAKTGADEIRTIHLAVRDMTYYVEGQNASNPTLRVRRGEHVRIIVSNHDVGMKHDFGVDAWRKRTGLIDGVGEVTVEFSAPATAGESVYSCTPHGAMMHGTIRVE
jgi:plastocyanin